MQLAMTHSSQANNIPFLSAQVKTELPNSFGSLQGVKSDSSFLNMVKSYEHDVKSESSESLSSENQAQKTKPSEAEKPSENTSSAAKEQKSGKMEKTKSPEEETNSKEKVSSKNEKKKTENKGNSDESLAQKTAQTSVLKQTADEVSKLSVDDKKSAKAVNSAAKSKATENELAENQMSFLKTREDSEDPESILANAEDYKANKSEKDLLEEAQNLSLENPETFLKEAQTSKEAGNASFITKTTSLNGKELETAKDSAKKVSSKKNNLFTVIDERGSASKEESSKVQKSKLSVSKNSESNNELNLTMSLNKNAEQNILSTSSQTAGSTGSNFQAMLSEQIQQNAPEFVKAGNIVLQDSKTGTINMVLKPESLGNVKISLQLSDKVITGQITVQSQEAYDAFKQNIETLKQAFQQSGFESPQFNLSFSNNGGFENSQQGRQQMANNWYRNQAYSDCVSDSSSNLCSNSDFVHSGKSSTYVIDVVA